MGNTLTIHSKIKKPADILSRKVQDEEVILHLKKGIYFGLNEVGTKIWDMAETGMNVGQIIKKISAEFDITEARAERDVMDLLKDLKKKHLVEVL